MNWRKLFVRSTGDRGNEAKLRGGWLRLRQGRQSAKPRMIVGAVGAVTLATQANGGEPSRQLSQKRHLAAVGRRRTPSRKMLPDGEKAGAMGGPRLAFGERVPWRTGPLEVLHTRDVVVLCDVDNLSLGARDLGYKVSYAALAKLLRQSSRSCRLHAFFPGGAEARGRIEYFKTRGWAVHVNEIEVVQTYRGWRRICNSDNSILLWAGWLAGRMRVDLLVVASGDGSLVCDIARFFATCQPACDVVTLSLVGSTSMRLDASTNPHVRANVSLGHDALRPVLAKPGTECITRAGQGRGRAAYGIAPDGFGVATVGKQFPDDCHKS